jgi:hypothetical protein
MTGEELERRLRRFRVVAPAPSLRARVLQDSVRQSARRDFAIGWGIAAAVVLLLWTAGRVSMRERERRIDETLATAPISSEVEEAVRLLGPRGREVVRLRVLVEGVKEQSPLLDRPSVDVEYAPW